MKVVELNKSVIEDLKYCFSDDIKSVIFYVDNDVGGILEDDIYLPDYFEDWESPTATEMSLFELANGYKIEFV